VKILAKQIDVYVVFLGDSKPHPVRFRIKKEDSEEKIVIKVDKVLSVADNKNAGKLSYIYRCRGRINGSLREYELKYRINECKWELYKM